MSTIHDQRYIKLVAKLREIRNASGITQKELASRLGQPQSYIAKVEKLERRLDIVELADWLSAVDYDLQNFFTETGILHINYSTSIPALPIPGKALPTQGGIILPLAWQGKEIDITLEGITVQQYLDLERDITQIYRTLNNPKGDAKNREVICQALQLAITKLPLVNPSDIYHHIVYRLYLREYTKTHADRSWVRAGGEALEIFVETHYAPVLKIHGITIKALLSNNNKFQALKGMGIDTQVGSSKLDIALYGSLGKEEHIFGGIHIKASLAERVSDDVPCSQAMMAHGYTSFLLTFDAKSFPPPVGDLINRGELGSPTSPSDKRKYIEEQGLFDACFSYNLRSIPSTTKTLSGKKIYVGSFEATNDPLPTHIIAAWESFRKRSLS